MKFTELSNVGAKAGFDATLLADNWLTHALELIPPTYRGVVSEEFMSNRHHIEGRTNAIIQRCCHAKRMMRAALAKVG